MNPAFEFRTKDGNILNKELLTELKDKAFAHPSGVYRFNFHENHESKTQEMLICLTNETICNIHKHLDKDETIEIIEGEVEIKMYTEELEVISVQILTLKANRMIKLQKDSIHSVKVKSDYAIIREVTTGPFIKENCLILGSC